MRSFIVAVYELIADEVFIVWQHDCGMSSINPSETITKMMERRGVSFKAIETLESARISLQKWLHVFDSVEDSVKASVQTVKNHPLPVKNFPVHGLVIDPKTRKLDLVVDRYKNL